LTLPLPLPLIFAIAITIELGKNKKTVLINRTVFVKVCDIFFRT